ncbi:hypothetical protein P2Q02_03385 [Bacillus pumilus]|uniref:hypothetical protein n=1 Tax=Bacillus TaxID=1386 RepID=UPI0016705C9D|nr:MULTISPECIES: hypothetical protein [Bacillus]MDF2001688.1 hypothetical protein [Bacillus pumilus]MDF2022943.1 hypothetical protein [Bacillus pumilus]MDF2026570.1 hypothetical protein [Bacillus pumilus]MDF2087753.1 hypothetical protein [Bacillus pumilus]
MSERIKKIVRAGVSESQIENMSTTYPHNYPDFRLYKYVPKMEEEKERLVEVSKIVGAYRVKSKDSWLENFDAMGSRVDYLIDSLEKKGLESYKKSFKEDQDRKIHLSYLEDLDCYFTSGDGNHRTVVAKVIGMNYIQTKVSHYQPNIKRIKIKKKLDLIKKEIFEKVKNMNFDHDVNKNTEQIHIDIFYKELIIQSIFIEDEYILYPVDQIENLQKSKDKFIHLCSKIETYKLLPKIFKTIFLAFYSRGDRKIKDIIKGLERENYFIK